jgi:hypothetical protein
MNIDKFDNFLDRELDHLRTEMAAVATPSNVEAALVSAFAKHQRSPEKLRRKQRSKQSWLATCAHWLAPVSAVAASVVMVAWLSLNLLAPTTIVSPVAARDQASQLESTSGENGAPFFALQSLEQISLEPNPRLIETQIPRTILASMGAAVSPDSASDLVHAEMLVSAAGQPLALRFLAP